MKTFNNIKINREPTLSGNLTLELTPKEAFILTSIIGSHSIHDFYKQYRGFPNPNNIAVDMNDVSAFIEDLYDDLSEAFNK
jgi:hypothetical protein